MKSFRISSRDAFVEVEIDSEDLRTPYGDGDFRAACALQSRGFTGTTHFWLAHRSLRAFSKGILLLEELRQGEAILGSMSPGEFDLRIYSTSPLGHLALNASIMHRFPVTYGELPHSAGISFELDPTELQGIANDPVIRALAN